MDRVRYHAWICLRSGVLQGPQQAPYHWTELALDAFKCTSPYTYDVHPVFIFG